MPSAIVEAAFQARLLQFTGDSPPSIPAIISGQPSPNHDAFIVLQFPIVEASQPVLARHFFEDGIARVVINVRRSWEMDAALALCDDVARIYRRRKLGNGIETFVPRLSVINEASNDGNWFTMSVLVPYRHQFDDFDDDDEEEGGGGGETVVPGEFAFQSTGKDAVAGTSHTIAGLTTASALGKEWFVVLGWTHIPARTVTAVTIEGQPATFVARAIGDTDGNGNSPHTEIWRAAGNASTTVSVVVTYDGSSFGCCCALYVGTGIGALLDTDASALDGLAGVRTDDLSVDTVADGAVLAGAYAYSDGSDVVETTWTGLTEDVDGIANFVSDALSTASAGPTTVETPRDIDISWANVQIANNSALGALAVSFGPGVGDGFPDAATTGVPSGTVLAAPTSGDLNSSSNGEIIELRDHTGQVIITHDNVTVRKCRIQGVVVVVIGADNCTVEDCDIDNGGLGGKGIWFDEVNGGNAYRNDISGAEDGIYMAGTGLDVRDNYIHDLAAPGVDPHYDGIQNGSSNSTVAHNAVRIGIVNMSSAMTNGPTTDVLITNNLFDGGAYSLRVEVAGSTGYTITNNHFGENEFGYWSLEGTVSPTISGNVDHVTGAPVT